MSTGRNFRSRLGSTTQNASRSSQWPGRSKSFCPFCQGQLHTGDGRHPAQVHRWFIRLFTRFQPSKVVQDLFHPLSGCAVMRSSIQPCRSKEVQRTWHGCPHVWCRRYGHRWSPIGPRKSHQHGTQVVGPSIGYGIWLVVLTCFKF